MIFLNHYFHIFYFLLYMNWALLHKTDKNFSESFWNLENKINSVEEKTKISIMHQSSVSVWLWVVLWNPVFPFSSECLFEHKEIFPSQYTLWKRWSNSNQNRSIVKMPSVSQQFNSNNIWEGNIEKEISHLHKILDS